MPDFGSEKDISFGGTPRKKVVFLQHIADLITAFIYRPALEQDFSGGDFQVVVISPPIKGSSPAIRESRVDFPQPEGPTIAINSPSFSERLMSCRAFVSPSGE